MSLSNHLNRSLKISPRPSLRRFMMPLRMAGWFKNFIRPVMTRGRHSLTARQAMDTFSAPSHVPPGNPMMQVRPARIPSSTVGMRTRSTGWRRVRPPFTARGPLGPALGQTRDWIWWLPMNRTSLATSARAKLSSQISPSRLGPTAMVRLSQVGWRHSCSPNLLSLKSL